MDRNEILARVRGRSQLWDIVVIGGGATGVGCAVDAASRGYDVLLLEQHDFGKGTSSRSTKLVHGGVRYLVQGNISLVREALKERGILLRNAPHVVHSQVFIVPCYSLWQKLFYGTGLKIYDLLSGKNSFGKSRILSKSETAKRLPNIKTEGLSGGVLYNDGQFDDTRLLIDLVKTAHHHGAAVLNYTKVTSLIKDQAGKINAVQFEDAVAAEKFTVSAKVVINATGAFCDAVREMSSVDSKPLVALSQGIHLVFGPKFLASSNAVMIPKTNDGRILFCIPWHGHTLVGTTDTPISQTNLEPQALDSEIDFVLETAAKYLEQKPTRGDILSIFTGIRPLVKSGAAKNTASLSRGHTIEISDSGLLTITGGKWTTYRRMSEDAVDHAARLAGLDVRPSVTGDLKITASTEALTTTKPLHPDLPYTREDVIRAVRDEMAQTVEDVLARRTRALFLNANAAIELAPLVAEIMATELDKEDDWKTKELSDFLRIARSYQGT
ncbi:MAG: glycerol-3-phosphate dehydrogenase/oxidase [Pyrinomonadaceae bacterium]